jgi:parvulin-like peptidyl-prolyl isomerase
MPGTLSTFKAILCLLAGAWLLGACDRENTLPTPTGISQPSPALPTSTLTPFPPSPTPVPLAARVNGEEITLAEYEAELARYQAAWQDSEGSAEVDAREQVLADLINQVLLAQGARQAGISLAETELQTRLNELAEEAGGDQAMAAWLAAQGYSEEAFQSALARSLAAARMRDQILAGVPETAEQVHARQILLYNSDEASEVLARLESGEDFATLAAEFDPGASGDLGWFPRGYLTEPQLEETAFSLQPEEYSQVIETGLGFHLLQVIERDPQRPLDPDARLVWQMQALRDWLETRRSESEIQTLLPD